MSDEIPFWREAINKSDHPLHNAAWMIFSESFKTEKVAKRLESKKQDVIDFCMKVLEVDDLYNGERLGSGYAAINSVRLLGEWQVVEALPRMLTIIADEDEDSIIYDETARALRKMPSIIIDRLIEFGDAGDFERKITVASILARLGEGTDRCFDYICPIFERATDEIDIAYLGEMLIEYFPEKAKLYLEEKIKAKKYREFREHFLGLIKEYQERTE